MLSGMGYPTGKKPVRVRVWVKTLNPHAGMGFLVGMS
jgi:hypothetical protein